MNPLLFVVLLFAAERGRKGASKMSSQTTLEVVAGIFAFVFAVAVLVIVSAALSYWWSVFLLPGFAWWLIKAAGVVAVTAACGFFMTLAVL